MNILVKLIFHTAILEVHSQNLFNIIFQLFQDWKVSILASMFKLPSFKSQIYMGQCRRFQDLSHQPAAKAQASLHIYTKYGCRWRLRLEFRSLALQDASAWTFKHLCCDMRFSTMWYVRPAKAQTSLRICPVWSEFLLVPWLFFDC